MGAAGVEPDADQGQLLRPAQFPVIVSASRSTDIPGFYSDWFLHRLKVGYSAWTNPFNGVKSYVSYRDTRLIVFWSKNPESLLKQGGLLDYLEELNQRTFLLVEYGIESASDDTLRRVNRGHTFAQTKEAVRRTVERGIRVGGHVILGFPWESHDELMRQADEIAKLPLTTLKLHQLQIIRGTALAHEYERHPWPLPKAEDYIRLVLDYIAHLPQTLVLERFVSQCPPDLLVAPNWGLKNYEFANLLKNLLDERENGLASKSPLSENRQTVYDYEKE